MLIKGQNTNFRGGTQFGRFGDVEIWEIGNLVSLRTSNLEILRFGVIGEFGDLGDLGTAIRE